MKYCWHCPEQPNIDDEAIEAQSHSAPCVFKRDQRSELETLLSLLLPRSSLLRY